MNIYVYTMYMKECFVLGRPPDWMVTVFMYV